MNAHNTDDIDVYDFGSDSAQTYTEHCEVCGKTHEVSTQKNICPEYITTVFVKCDCGSSVEFELPVN